MCSRTLGPAILPSLVTCPITITAILLFLAMIGLFFFKIVKVIEIIDLASKNRTKKTKEIKALEKLKKGGYITEEEFTGAKNRVLESYGKEK